MKNLIQRALTGLVYIALILSSIFVGSYLYLGVFAVLCAACLLEFYGLLNTRKETTKVNSLYHTFGGVLLFVLSYFVVSDTCDNKILFLYLIYLISIFIIQLYNKKAEPISSLALSLLGQIYIALPFSLLNILVFRTTGGVIEYNHIYILALFVFIWINDTGAYVVGVSFGKHRLFERISPKKSWEGFVGGLVFSIASSFAFYHFFPTIPLYHWIILSALVVALATWGDLIESLIKRTIGIKDSGIILPGHGGILDRLDSFLLAVYAVVIYSQLFIIQN
jgi:CDP-diglyceride synthetase